MSRRLPSEEVLRGLLATAGCSEKVVEHCEAVASFAVEIAQACFEKGRKVDVALVRAGALLHDIGRSRTHGVNHNIVGGQIAKRLNLPDNVVSIVERHVGAGITESEAKKLGWPAKNYTPESLEERIVAYADKRIEDSKRVPIAAAIERLQQDRNVPVASVKRLECWHEELSLCFE